jgi:hypothetical protein
MDRLTSIRSREAEMRSTYGHLSMADQSYLQDRLDRLSASLNASTAPH